MDVHLIKATSFNAENLTVAVFLCPNLSVYPAYLYHDPKWFKPQIKLTFRCIYLLRCTIRKSCTAIRANQLASLVVNLQALMTTAKEMHGTKLTAAFSHKSKDLYRHLHHLSSYCTTQHQFIIVEKVEVFSKFFNSTFTVSDFVLPTVHRMPKP